MFKLDYSEVISKISEKSGLSEEEIEAKVKSKVDQLSDLVSKDGAAHIVANELGIKIFDYEKKEYKIKDLIVGLRSLTLNAKVVQKFDVIEFNKNNRQGKVLSLVVGDETGSTRLVVWDENLINDFSKVNDNDIIQIRNGYVRQNNDYKEVHLGNTSTFEVNPEGVEIKEVKEVSFERSYGFKKIVDLKENDFAKINATIVQIFEPRFYMSCSECRKKVEVEGDKYKCVEHGLVKEVPVPIVNVYLDDGSENIRAVAFRDVANEVLDLSEEEVLKLRDGGNFEELRNKLLGKQFSFSGRVNKNDMFDRLELVINEVGSLEPEKLADELISEVGS